MLLVWARMARMYVICIHSAGQDMCDHREGNGDYTLWHRRSWVEILGLLEDPLTQLRFRNKKKNKKKL